MNYFRKHEQFFFLAILCTSETVLVKAIVYENITHIFKKNAATNNINLHGRQSILKNQEYDKISP